MGILTKKVVGFVSSTGVIQQRFCKYYNNSPIKGSGALPKDDSDNSTPRTAQT